MFEFRWAVPEATSTEKPVLQWRHRYDSGSSDFIGGGPRPEIWSPWTTVPTVVVPEAELRPAPRTAR